MREAILRLTDEQLERIGLGGVVATAREAGLRELTELVCHGPGGVIMFRVDEPLDEEAFGAFEAVEWWERLSASDEAVTYLCKIDAPELPADFSPDDLGVAHDVDAVRADGIDLSVIGSHDAISQGVATASDAGMDLLLERLTAFEGDASTLDALTDRQQHVIETAYAMGYYEVPREASTAAVAERLGLDRSTVAEHLQRAERNLLGRLVGDRPEA